ncbi:adenylate/guanylate cyclase domain-containing protein [Mesorhizobium sp.]|uniref:adenylate/guanylate cyclase domain-containing protein n=1 Tax=Mesorhizobium sp. TaxID=1871066 RepID=UPI00120B24A7|nr:adenylate/guanylate cyclase domain-containing protein [Mesorhizobium sp.]TIN07718.1 MAG: hypothetical protein E5Y14_23805 [Mesorhizobium sp.]
MNIAVWLRGLGLEQYILAFDENAIDAEILPRLTAEDLKEIGVAALAHRKRILEAIAAMQGEPALEPAKPASASPIRTSASVDRSGEPGRPREAERRQLTVMFVDLVGSTALATRLDPEEMRDLLRKFQNTVAGEVVRYEGHIAKLMGDGVLAYFGWPQAHEDEAERAVRAALAVVAAVADLSLDDGQQLSVRGRHCNWRRSRGRPDWCRCRARECSRGRDP